MSFGPANQSQPKKLDLLMNFMQLWSLSRALYLTLMITLCKRHKWSIYFISFLSLTTVDHHLHTRHTFMFVKMFVAGYIYDTGSTYMQWLHIIASTFQICCYNPVHVTRAIRTDVDFCIFSLLMIKCIVKVKVSQPLLDIWANIINIYVRHCQF